MVVELAADTTTWTVLLLPTGMTTVWMPEAWAGMEAPTGSEVTARGWLGIEVSTAGWVGIEVATAGCEVTTAGPPVITPRELVWWR